MSQHTINKINNNLTGFGSVLRHDYDTLANEELVGTVIHNQQFQFDEIGLVREFRESDVNGIEYSIFWLDTSKTTWISKSLLTYKLYMGEYQIVVPDKEQ